MDHSNTRRSTHRTAWWRPLALFFGVLALIGTTEAQISYTQDFTGCSASPCNDWTITQGYSPNITSTTGEGYSPCSATNPAAKSNIYPAEPVTNLFHTTSLGTSTGAQATLTFDYKCIEYGSGTATPAGVGTIQPQWSVDGTTWNVITTFANVSSATCVNTGSLNYVPPTGQPVFIRILAQSAGDFWFVVDNITYDQPINPACSGTPAPGNTVASVTSACDGEDFTLSLENLTPGNNVGYQWYDGAGMIPGANSSTLVTNQSVATDYYCEVTCDASTVASATLNVPMTTLTLPEDMEAGFYPPGCWSETEEAPGDNYIFGVSGFSAYEVGSFSFLFDFFNAPDGTEFILTSPILPTTPAGYQVAFDVAGASYSGTEIDVIHLEESLDGGATWNILQTMTNEDGVGVLSTKPANNTGLLPVAADWVSLAYPINAGADRIRFRAVSNFGNRVFMDNITVEALPDCETPTGVDHVLNNQTEAVISWTLTSADSYNVEIRSSGLPGTGGEDAALTGQTGPTSDPITLAADQNYFAYVQGVCSGTPGDWSNAHPFRTGYCLAGALALTDEKIINVSVANINNPSPGIQVGYENYTAIVADMAPGTAYPFSIVPSPVYASDRLLIWVDWNNDFDFDDAGENVYSSPGAANPFLGSITVPAAQPAGFYRMRIRLHDSAFGPNSTPCGDSDYGQVEDYTIKVCSAPEVSISVLDDCEGDVFVPQLNITSFGSEIGGSISYSINGGTPNLVVAAPGSNVGPAVPVGGYVNVVVDNGTECLLDLGAWYSNCPDTVICSNPPESNTYCYKNGDTRTFHYQVEVGETVTLNFSGGSLDLNDAVNFYSGSNNLGTSIIGGNFSGSLTGQNITSTGNELYFEIISDGSNSCFDGGQSTPWAWTVGCTPDCVPAEGAVSYLTPAYTCDPNEFSLEFLLIDLGFEDGIGTPATSATLEWTIDGGSPGSQALTAADLFTPFNIGPFPLGSDVNVVIAHGTNSDCDKNLGIFTQADVCPPLNDECTTAETLNIVSVDGCPAGNITGTTAFATSSVGGTIPPPSCNVGTGNLQDVWYTFNTASYQSPLLMNFSAGTALSYGVELFDAGEAPDCLGALIGCLPNSPTGINFTGFGTNEQYYLRVFTYDGTGTAGTFNLCLAASSCPTPTGIASSGITDNQATITWTGPFSNYIIEYGPTVSFTTPGTGATPGPGGTIITANESPLTITGLTASTQYTFYMRRDCGSPDGFSLNSGGFVFTTQAPPPPAVLFIEEWFDCDQSSSAPPPFGDPTDIPDNGCATNNSLTADLVYGIELPPGSTLGVDVVLESVDLVVTHTWRSDLQISVISPGGQVRNLIVASGGSNENFGDPGSCIPIKLKDGAPSLATLPATDNTTGTYAPAQPLSTLTGPAGFGIPGEWKIRICDAATGDVGTLDYVNLNFAPCVGPNFSTAVTTDCGDEEYSVNVTINLMGSAGSYDITNSLNGDIVTANATGMYTVGPFPAGTPVDLTLNHDANAVCTATALGLVGLCPPDNDLCGDAIAISCNSVTSGTTSGATAEAPAPAFCGTGLTAPGVWYTVAGFDGDMEVTTCGSSSPYDTKLNVYTGSCGSWTCVGGNDDSTPDCGFFLSRFAWTGSSAETYYILVQGFNGETGDFDLTVTCGDFNPACTENGLNLEFQNATNPGGVTWEIEDETGSVVVLGGTNVFPADAVGTQAICLP
ncbi:MAG: proprotein convertase P-domain-containing protein, partial [Flavobacteriales bacterium]|nr:proprotein convertase P-domain-containing protein [Flavobacteriales bacterium]